MDHEEIDHHGAEHIEIALLRAEIDPFLYDLHEALHDGCILPAGKQWTIEMNTSCGFKARLIIQVDDLGSCNNEVTNGHG